jgi:hypothetical protein
VGELVPLLGGAGVFGVLALVIFHLLSSNRQDRQQYETFANRAAKDVTDAENREADARALIEQERNARWAAEDRAAQLARQVRELGGSP